MPLTLITVGHDTYGKLNILWYRSPEDRLQIGCYCSIAKNVVFLLGGGHDYQNMMSFPLRNKLSRGEINESVSKGPIVVDDDVWIGYGATILSGVHIGQGAVIGAGSVVAKDIPPYAIYAGGRIIKYRFEEDVRKELLKIDFSKLTIDEAGKHLGLFYGPVNLSTVTELQSMIK